MPCRGTLPAQAQAVAVKADDAATAYARAVAAGKIVAGPHVRNACRRHLLDLYHAAARGVTGDAAAVARVVGFFK